MKLSLRYVKNLKKAAKKGGELSQAAKPFCYSFKSIEPIIHSPSGLDTCGRTSVRQSYDVRGILLKPVQARSFASHQDEGRDGLQRRQIPYQLQRTTPHQVAARC